MLLITECIYHKCFQSFFVTTHQIPIEIGTGSKSLYDALHSKKNLLEKYLRIDIAPVKEFLDLKFITKVHNVL